jgi:hypothetical protein
VQASHGRHHDDERNLVAMIIVMAKVRMHWRVGADGTQRSRAYVSMRWRVGADGTQRPRAYVSMRWRVGADGTQRSRAYVSSVSPRKVDECVALLFLSLPRHLWAPL